MLRSWRDLRYSLIISSRCVPKYKLRRVESRAGWASSLTLGIQRIENALLKELSSNENPDDLISISKVYEQEAVDRKKAGQRYQGYELIKEVAGFKARLQHLAKKRVEETDKRRASHRTNAFLLSTCFLHVEDFLFSHPKRRVQESTSTLATVDRLNALRYIVSIAEPVM